MADTKLGGVYYEVDAKTDGLLQLQNSVDKATDSIAKDFKQADSAISQSTARMSTSMTGTAKAVGQATSAFRLQKGSAQQLGFQLQDVAVQAQMGTSWFTILGQQGSQLAAVMGPGGALFGAVIAISAAIGGVLVKAMQNAGDATKKLPEELQKRLDDIKKSLQDVDEESKSAFTQVEIGKVNAEYNELGNTINKLREANIRLEESSKSANDPRTAKLAEQALFANRRAIEENIAKQAELGLLQEKITQEVILSKDGWEQYKDEAQKSLDITAQIAQQVQVATEKVINGENAARRMALAFQLGLTSAEMLPAELQKSLDILERAEAAAKEESEWRKQLLDDQRQVAADMLAEEKAASAERRKLAQEEVAERKRLEAVAGGNVGLTRLQQLTQQYEQERQLLIAAQEAKIESEISYEERLKQLKLQYAEETAAEQKRIQEQQKSDTQKALEAAGFSYEQLSNQAIGTFAAIATGAQSGREAIRSLAQSILTQAIGALIKMLFVSKSGQAAATAAGVATAGALSTAYATPAALVSLASFGANAAPAAAGISSTVGLAQGLALGTGRLYGGPVSAGTMYPITENGKPEILQQGNRQYLLPGTGGNVISNKDMMSAGGNPVNVTVNVNNSSSANVDVQRRQGPDRSEIIEIVVADIQGRGRVQRAITSTTTASNKV